ncbi:MAG TPA: site-specific integrase [Candidatus Kapabacteria bacterium]|nr:site-specific integrase [Candidatus Kapabacteria bacterium]
MSVKLRTKQLADGRRSYYLDIYHKGKRQYKFLNLYHEKDNTGGANAKTRQLAEKIRADFQLRVSAIAHGGSAIEIDGADRNFIDYFDSFRATKSPGTQGTYGTTLLHLKRFGGESIRFAEIDEAWVKRWRAYLLASLGQNTAFLHFTVVKSAFKQAVRERIIQTNPCEHVERIKQQETIRGYLTMEEVEKLAVTECAHPVIKRAFLFACFTGLRLSDVQALVWGRIRDGRIAFRQQKTGGVEYFKLHDVALAMMGEPGAPEAQVFALPHESVINKTLKKWGTSAGIEKHMHFHLSRHTFATTLLTYDVDIATVSKMLGHRNLATTLIYAKVVNTKIDRAVDSLPSITVGGAGPSHA